MCSAYLVSYLLYSFSIQTSDTNNTRFPCKMAETALLIVIGEAQENDHLNAIADRLAEGIGAINLGKCSPNFEAELSKFSDHHVPLESCEVYDGFMRSNNNNVSIEVLINPCLVLFMDAFRNFLMMNSTSKILIHAGPAYTGSGSWILRDGTFSFHDLVRILYRAEVFNTINNNIVDPASHITINCINEGDWNDNGLKIHDIAKHFRLKISQSPSSSLPAQNPSYADEFLSFLKSHLTFRPLNEIMTKTKMIGNIKFRQPTVYIFPAGNGDACFFGVDGFNVLIDGGSLRKPCHWEFLSHMDKVDCVVCTRVSYRTMKGMNSLLKRLSSDPNLHPSLAHCFYNLPAKIPSNNDAAPKHNLLVSLLDQSQDIVTSLKVLNLKAHPLSAVVNPASKHLEPITLYQKIGLGRLDMYVLNPAKDSRETAEFMSNWRRFLAPLQPSSFSLKPGYSGTYPFPLIDQCSIAVLFVWHPSSDNERVIRILYPGSCPQDRLFQAMDKVKHLEFLRRPSCTVGSLTTSRPSFSLSASSTNKKNAALNREKATVDINPKLTPKSLPKTTNGHLKEKSSILSSTAATPSEKSVEIQLITDENDPNTHAGGGDSHLNGCKTEKTEIDGIIKLDLVEKPATEEETAAIKVDEKLTFDELIDLKASSPKSEAPKKPEVRSEVICDSNVPEVSSPKRTFPISSVTYIDIVHDQKNSKIDDLLSSPTKSPLDPNAPVFVPRVSIQDSSPTESILQEERNFSDVGPSQEPVIPTSLHKTIDQLKEEWGSPLGLPPPPVQDSMPTNQEKGTAQSQKEKLNEASGRGGAANAKTATSAKSSAETTSSSHAPYVFKARPAPKRTSTNAANSNSQAAKKPLSEEAPSNVSARSTGGTDHTIKIELTKQAVQTKKQALAPRVAVKDAPAKVPTSVKIVQQAKPVKPMTSPRALPAVSVTPRTTPASSKKSLVSATSPPFFVDLTYIPHNGNPNYFSSDFAKIIRARYYVLSSVSPSKECFEALFAGKKAWQTPDQPTTLIPTYDSEILNVWMALRRDELAAENFDVAPSCVRCTLNLEGQQGPVCATYRLEL